MAEEGVCDAQPAHVAKGSQPFSIFAATKITTVWARAETSASHACLNSSVKVTTDDDGRIAMLTLDAQEELVEVVVEDPGLVLLGLNGGVG